MNSRPKDDGASATDKIRSAGRWARALDLLHQSDPEWTESYSRMAINPWTSGTLRGKDIQLIAVGLSGSITNLDESALRRQIRAALHAGATKEEILEVLKMAAIVATHSMSLGAPILIEEAAAAGKTLGSTGRPATPACDKMKAIGQWNQAWDPFYALDPSWTDELISAATGFYTSGLLSPKFVELISIAFDASITHMYAPGVRRHIKGALALGATVDEIAAVLKLCVSQGANALDLGVPVLAEEAALFAGEATE